MGQREVSLDCLIDRTSRIESPLESACTPYNKGLCVCVCIYIYRFFFFQIILFISSFFSLSSPNFSLASLSNALFSLIQEHSCVLHHPQEHAWTSAGSFEASSTPRFRQPTANSPRFRRRRHRAGCGSILIFFWKKSKSFRINLNPFLNPYLSLLHTD
jgi:hypothetical protein